MIFFKDAVRHIPRRQRRTTLTVMPQQWVGVVMKTLRAEVAYPARDETQIIVDPNSFVSLEKITKRLARSGSATN
jgi:hypothetical protein